MQLQTERRKHALYYTLLSLAEPGQNRHCGLGFQHRCASPTGSMASAHSPWPRCNILIRSTSLQICTRSPTANCVGTLVSLEPDAALLGVCTFVKTAGLNVHLHVTLVGQKRAQLTCISTKPCKPHWHQLFKHFFSWFRFFGVINKNLRCKGRKETDLFPLGYETTMSWSSSIPTTVPVVPRHWKQTSIVD